MEFIVITFAIFWILAIVFRWLWINFLRDFLIVLLPPSDHPNAHELESMHRDFDRAFGEKRK
jgi:hypothetical protein